MISILAIMGVGRRPSADELQAELDDVRREAAERDRQLERYAEDLRDTFRRERERAAELRESYVQTVRALANAVEARDAYTGGHAERVAAFGCAVAGATGLDCARRPELEFGFLLHDVGKLGVPDAVLTKPGKLSEDDWRHMHRHTVTGWEILRPVGWLGEGRSVVRSHHERWDGSGYPDGLVGERIPLPARVFAVADALDALTSERPYRPAVSLEQAREVIRHEAGTQFDPDAVRALLDVPEAELEAIRAGGA